MVCEHVDVWILSVLIFVSVLYVSVIAVLAFID